MQTRRENLISLGGGLVTLLLGSNVESQSTQTEPANDSLRAQKDRLFDILDRERVEIEKLEFGKNYQDLLQDLVEKFEFMKYEKVRPIIPDAEALARKMRPQRNFRADIVEAAFSDSVKTIKDDSYLSGGSNRFDSAKYAFDLGNNLARDFAIPTDIYANKVIDAVVSAARKSLKIHDTYTAQKGLNFLQQITGKAEAQNNALWIVIESSNSSSAALKEFDYERVVNEHLDFIENADKQFGTHTAPYVGQIIKSIISSAQESARIKDTLGAMDYLNFGKKIAQRFSMPDYVMRIDAQIALIKK